MLHRAGPAVNDAATAAKSPKGVGDWTRDTILYSTVALARETGPQLTNQQVSLRLVAAARSPKQSSPRDVPER